MADGKEDLAGARTERNVILGAMVAVFLLAGGILAVLVKVLVARPVQASVEPPAG